LLVVTPSDAFTPFSQTASKRSSQRQHTSIKVLADPLETSSASAAQPLIVNKAPGSSTQIQSIRQPSGSQKSWEVHKFGGASLATAELYQTVGDLLLREAKRSLDDGGSAVPTMAIVSARAGMTDLLVKVVDSALTDFDDAKKVLQDAVEGQIDIVKGLAPESITKQIEANIRQDAEHILLLVQSLRMINTVPAVTMEVVTGYGEIWSAQTLNAYLQAQQLAGNTQVPCEWLDARPVLKVGAETSSGLGEKGAASTGGVRVEWEATAQNLDDWWSTTAKDRGMHNCNYAQGVSPIVIVTGFVASTTEGVPTTLKRSGSDYSATIFAKLTGASRVTMWKNTDGVYTADPRRVPEAFSIDSLKYDEALELAYFGAQVLRKSQTNEQMTNVMRRCVVLFY
jgi:aspartokinase/homoserine dehydrogenase 1